MPVDSDEIFEKMLSMTDDRPIEPEREDVSYGYERAWNEMMQEMPSAGPTEKPNETTPGYGEF